MKASLARVVVLAALYAGAACSSSSRQKCQVDGDCGGGTCTAYGCVRSVTQTIGPAGGVVRTAQGDVAIEIPPGALTSPTPITIRPAGPAVFRVERKADAQRGVGTGFEIALGVPFAQPAKITFSYAGLDLRELSERLLCITGHGSWGAPAEIPPEACSVNLSRRTVTATFSKGDRFMVFAFDPVWEATSQPTVEGTTVGGPGPTFNTPSPIPLPVEDNFDGSVLNTTYWRFYLQESSTAVIQNGVAAATASLDSNDRARAGVELEFHLTDRIQAALSRLRITGSEGDTAGSRIRGIGGFAYNAGIDPNHLGGFTGEVYARVNVALNGTVSGLVLLCDSADCRQVTVIHSEPLATGVDVNAFHTYSVGFDPATGTFYFRFDEDAPATYKVDTAQYPVVHNSWLFVASRAEVRNTAGSKLSIEIDRMKVGMLTDIFGSLP